VPCLVRWKGKIAPGVMSDRVTGFEDWLPTLLELIGEKASTPADIDGISFGPTLLGKRQEARQFLYRESPGYGGQQCARVGDWKAIRVGLNPKAKSREAQPAALQLYNIAQEPREANDVAQQHPEIVKPLSALMQQQHVKSPLFPIRALDGGAE